MKHRVPGIAVALFSVQFVAAVGYEVWQRAASAPRNIELPMLSFPSPSIDAGDVECGKTWTGSVLLTNTGDVPGVIRKITRSCGCTALDISEGDIIEPGESREVNLRLDVGSTNGVRSNVALLCEYSDLENRIPNTASLYLSAVATCEGVITAELPSPVPDPSFQEGVDQP